MEDQKPKESQSATAGREEEEALAETEEEAINSTAETIMGVDEKKEKEAMVSGSSTASAPVAGEPSERSDDGFIMEIVQQRISDCSIPDNVSFKEEEEGKEDPKKEEEKDTRANSGSTNTTDSAGAPAAAASAAGAEEVSERSNDDGFLMEIVQQRSIRSIQNNASFDEEAATGPKKEEKDTLANSATSVSSRRMDDYIKARYGSNRSVQDMVQMKNSQRKSATNDHTVNNASSSHDLNKLDRKKIRETLRTSKVDGVVGAHQEYNIPLEYFESAHTTPNASGRQLLVEQQQEGDNDPNHDSFANEQDGDMPPVTTLTRQNPTRRQSALPGAVRISSNTNSSGNDNNNNNTNSTNNNALEEMNILQYVQQQLDASTNSNEFTNQQVIESLQQILANSTTSNNNAGASNTLPLPLESNDEGVPLEATLVMGESYNDHNGGRRDSSRGADAADSRRRSTKPLVEAVAVPVYSFKRLFLEDHRWLVTIGVLLLLGLGLGLGFGLTAASKGDQNDNNGLRQKLPILQRVRQRGYLKCGIGQPSPALNFWTTSNATTGEEEEERSGFDVALCRAIAAAVLGGPELSQKVEFTELYFEGRFEGLANDVVDVIAAGATHTMQRQVYESHTKSGFSFSVPYVYEGLQIAGDPFSVGCVENNMKITEECRVVKVCVIGGTSHKDVLSKRLPGRSLFVVKDYQEMVDSFADKKCAVIAHEGHQLQENAIRRAGYRGSYVIGNSIFSKEPLTLVSRKDDPEWATFVNTVLQGLLVAEKHNIAKSSADSFPVITAFGEQYQNMIKSAIAVVGHYGELYEAFFEPIIPRKAINMLNNNTESANGLLYSHPFGTADGDFGNASIGKVDDIKLKGKLRCGLVLDRPGFATVSGTGYKSSYKGMEVQLGRALSASLFEGDPFGVEFVGYSNPEEGLDAVRAGEVDLFAGAPWNFQNYINTAAKDISFSQPYFYRREALMSDAEENLCLATSSQDHGWASFVYWVVSGLIFAEESEIDTGTAIFMPEINLFGADYSRMLQDAVLAVGNFGEMYDENLEDIYPRAGTRNQLNDFLNGFPGPQHYPIPGIL